MPYATYYIGLLLTQAMTRIYNYDQSLSQTFAALKNSGIDAGVNYWDSGADRGVTKGKRGHFTRELDHCRGVAKYQQRHKYFLQYSAFPSERHQARTQGRQTCFLPRAPSNLLMPLGVVGLTTNHTSTLPRPMSLLGINSR